MCRGKQITNCGSIGASQFHGLGDSTGKLIAARALAEMEQRNRSAGAVLTTGAFDHPLPEQIIALRPSSLGAPLGQRRGACVVRRGLRSSTSR